MPSTYLTFLPSKFIQLIFTAPLLYVLHCNTEMKGPGSCLQRFHSSQRDCFLGNTTFRSKTQAPPCWAAAQMVNGSLVCVSVQNLFLTNPGSPAHLPQPQNFSEPGHVLSTWVLAKPWIKTFPGCLVCHQFKEIPNIPAYKT